MNKSNDKIRTQQEVFDLLTEKFPNVLADIILEYVLEFSCKFVGTLNTMWLNGSRKLASDGRYLYTHNYINMTIAAINKDGTLSKSSNKICDEYYETESYVCRDIVVCENKLYISNDVYGITIYNIPDIKLVRHINATRNRGVIFYGISVHKSLIYASYIYKIMCYTEEGELIREYNLRDYEIDPFYICVDDHNLYIADIHKENNRISIFSIEGEYKSEFYLTKEDKAERYKNIVLFDNHIYIAVQGIIYQCTKEGEIIRKFNVSDSVTGLAFLDRRCYINLGNYFDIYE